MGTGLALGASLGCTKLIFCDVQNNFSWSMTKLPYKEKW